jgi:hypothetical protein
MSPRCGITCLSASSPYLSFVFGDKLWAEASHARMYSATVIAVGSGFKFEQVNEVTWKLTNGEITNVPASHGQWGGYRTTKALAWVICVISGKWLARYRDMVSGPLSLTKAKAAAMSMAKGAVGDYCISNPIDHLNGLTARLIDSEADPLPNGSGEHD